MKKIIHRYGADLDWIDSFAKKLEGQVKDNFIIVPNTIQTGSRYFLKCEEGIIALYIDVKYHTDVEFIQKNSNDDFIAIYYTISESDAALTFDATSYKMSSLNYNLSVIDGSLEYMYTNKAGNEVFIFAILIKKNILRAYAEKNKGISKKINNMLNPKKNTFIQLDRMSNSSYQALIELRKLKVGDISFDLNMMGTVYLLISDYLDKMAEEKSASLQLVNKTDLANIILAQQYLIENLESPFLGNKAIAQKFNMSESKFKSLFKKITGTSPNTFFIENRLIKAKELLSLKEFSVTEISKKLGFTDISYFASKFKKKYGILPKTYSQGI